MTKHKLLILCWPLFFGDSSEVISPIPGCKGGQYIEYVSHWPSVVVITRLTEPKIVDALLMLISMMEQ